MNIAYLIVGFDGTSVIAGRVGLKGPERGGGSLVLLIYFNCDLTQVVLIMAALMPLWDNSALIIQSRFAKVISTLHVTVQYCFGPASDKCLFDL